MDGFTLDVSDEQAAAELELCKHPEANARELAEEILSMDVPGTTVNVEGRYISGACAGVNFLFAVVPWDIDDGARADEVCHVNDLRDDQIRAAHTFGIRAASVVHRSDPIDYLANWIREVTGDLYEVVDVPPTEFPPEVHPCCAQAGHPGHEHLPTFPEPEPEVPEPGPVLPEEEVVSYVRAVGLRVQPGEFRSGGLWTEPAGWDSLVNASPWRVNGTFGHVGIWPWLDPAGGPEPEASLRLTMLEQGWHGLTTQAGFLSVGRYRLEAMIAGDHWDSYGSTEGLRGRMVATDDTQWLTFSSFQFGHVPTIAQGEFSVPDPSGPWRFYFEWDGDVPDSLQFWWLRIVRLP